MVETGKKKGARIHFQLTAGSKRQLERAAAYEEARVSRFVLPAKDWDAFPDALLNPPAPNAQLGRAALCYRERLAG